jgi:exosortase D (VPLPA-CTERM-specific)
VAVSSPSPLLLRAVSQPANRLWPWAAVAAAIVVSFYFLFGRSLDVVLRSFEKPEFSHGYIVVLISAWIIWQRRRALWAWRGPGAWSGWLAVAAGLLLALVAHAANFVTPPVVGLLVLALGLVAATLGWASARLLLVPLAFLTLAYPLPDYLFIEISTSMQLVSSRIGAGLLDAADIAVFLDGNIIDLGTMKMQVAEACSGLRYLLPLASFGVLCAFMYRAPLWAKLVTVAATVPLAILLNGARIALTGALLTYGSRTLAEGFMHLFEGWVIFVVALAVLFALMFVMLRATGWRGRPGDLLDFDRVAATAAERRAAARSPAAPPLAAPPRSLLAATATILVAAALLVPLGARTHVVPERPGLATFPLGLGDWSAVPRFLDREVAQRLGADDYVLLDFTKAGARAPVNLWVASYDSLTAGASFHSPTTCLPGAGWEYEALGAHRTSLASFSGAPLVVNRGVVNRDGARILMYFWTELRGRAVHEFQEVKLRNLWDSLTTGRSDGALVRVYTPLGADETAAVAEARLNAFLAEAYGHLAPHLGR